MVRGGGLWGLLLWSLLSEIALARVCPSMDIRNEVSKFSLLADCQRIQGFLQVNKVIFLLLTYASRANCR